MKVDLFEFGCSRPYATHVPLSEAFPEQEDHEAAINDLRRLGEHLAGGGAAPAVLVRPSAAINYENKGKAK